MIQEFSKINQADALALAAVYLKDGQKVTIEKQAGKFRITTEKVEKEVKR